MTGASSAVQLDWSGRATVTRGIRVPFVTRPTAAWHNMFEHVRVRNTSGVGRLPAGVWVNASTDAGLLITLESGVDIERLRTAVDELIAEANTMTARFTRTTHH